MSNNDGMHSHEAPERVTWRGKVYGFGGDAARTEVVEVPAEAEAEKRTMVAEAAADHVIEGNTFQVSGEAGLRNAGVLDTLQMVKEKVPAERYRCKAGHEWEDDLYRVRFYRYPLPVLGGGIESVLEADSGPLCALCYAAALRQQFGGEPVVTDGAAAAHEEAAPSE